MARAIETALNLALKNNDTKKIKAIMNELPHDQLFIHVRNRIKQSDDFRLLKIVAEWNLHFPERLAEKMTEEEEEKIDHFYLALRFLQGDQYPLIFSSPCRWMFQIAKLIERLVSMYRSGLCPRQASRSGLCPRQALRQASRCGFDLSQQIGWNDRRGEMVRSYTTTLTLLLSEFLNKDLIAAILGYLFFL